MVVYSSAELHFLTCSWVSWCQNNRVFMTFKILLTVRLRLGPVWIFWWSLGHESNGLIMSICALCNGLTMVVWTRNTATVCWLIRCQNSRAYPNYSERQSSFVFTRQKYDGDRWWFRGLSNQTIIICVCTTKVWWWFRGLSNQVLSLSRIYLQHSYRWGMYSLTSKFTSPIIINNYVSSLQAPRYKSFLMYNCLIHLKKYILHTK